MEHASWYAVGIVGDVFVTTASHRYSEMAATNRPDVQNTGPAFSRRIFSNSSESVFPAAPAPADPGLLRELAQRAEHEESVRLQIALPRAFPVRRPLARAQTAESSRPRARRPVRVAVLVLVEFLLRHLLFRQPSGEISKMSSSDAPTATAMLVMSSSPYR